MREPDNGADIDEAEIEASKSVPEICTHALRGTHATLATEHQTIELVRAARIPMLEDAALDAIIQKALARDLNERFENAAELCDAAAGAVVARNLEVGPAELATLVREVQREVAAEAPPRAVDTATRDAVSRMVSVLAP